MKMFDAGKTRMIGLPYGEKNYDDMLSRFHLIPERHGRTDRQTDGRTGLLYQYRVKRDKNREIFLYPMYLAPPHGVNPSEFREDV